MITEKQKLEIKSYLGHRYVSVVQDELNLTNERDLKNKPYSATIITNVMNGQPHEVIEAAIYRAVERKKNVLKARENILKTA